MGYSQATLAAACGVTDCTVSSWENGRLRIHPRYHKRLRLILAGSISAAPKPKPTQCAGMITAEEAKELLPKIVSARAAAGPGPQQEAIERMRNRLAAGRDIHTGRRLSLADWAEAFGFEIMVDES